MPTPATRKPDRQILNRPRLVFSEKWSPAAAGKASPGIERSVLTSIGMAIPVVRNVITLTLLWGDDNLHRHRTTDRLFNSLILFHWTVFTGIANSHPEILVHSLFVMWYLGGVMPRECSVFLHIYHFIGDLDLGLH